MNRNLGIRFFYILICSFLFLGMKDVDPCLSEVRSVFNKLNDVSDKNKVSYINYSVIATLSSKDDSGKNIVNTGDFEMYANSQQNRIYSKDMIVLKDQESTYAILPAKKVIYISDAVKGNKNENLYDKLKILQDTIFKNLSKLECVMVKNKDYNKEVTLFLNEKISQFLEVKKIKYFINSLDLTLKRVSVEYLPNKQYKCIDYVFNVTNFNYKDLNLLNPVRDLVFESKSVLKKGYRDFKVIDNRKK